MTTRRSAGFTLIELLVVIAILSLLVVAFIPDLIGVGQQAKVAETEARRLFVNTGIEAFARQKGYFPPSDLKDLDPESKVKPRNDNGINTGIESLVVFLSQDRGGADLSEHAGWLGNTDKDDNGQLVPLLNTTERREVVDAWGNPYAYFSGSTAGSFDLSQKTRLAGDDSLEVMAKAWKGPDGYLGLKKYQMVSAGPDGVFNTEDDIVWPERK